MNLTLPTVSQTPGPSWANQINSDLTVIDSHNHTTGNGVAITTAALDIDDDLSFGQNAALNLSSIGLVNQASTPNSLRLYVTGNDLWYSYDGITPVQITTGGSIAGATGNISGMSPPAAVIFDSGTGTFTFWSNQSLNQQATLVSAQLRLRASIVAAPVTIAASASGSTYTLTLPDAPPGSAGLIGFSSGGALSAVTANSTLTITSSSITVATNGITPTQLNASAVTTAKIANNAVTQAKMEMKSPSSSNVINQTISNNLTYPPVANSSFSISLVEGRPVWIFLQSNYGSSGNVVSTDSPSGNNIKVRVTDPSTAYSDISEITLGNNQTYAPSIVSCVYVPMFTGSHTIELRAKTNGLGVFPSPPYVLTINNVRLNAFQL
jgi:hypothetical protein